MVNQSVRPVFGLLLLLGIFSMAPGAARGQWNSKPYQQWTAPEAKALLAASPWAQTREGLIKGGSLRPPDAEVDDTAVTVRLYSALPLRQALARLKQIKTQYDKKSKSNQAAIDAENKPMLECPACTDQYVVTVSPGPHSRNSAAMRFQTMLLAQLKLNVFIKNEKGETRELVDFVKPQSWDGDAMFFFPRLNSQGEPLISPINRTLIISFDSRLFGGFPSSLSKFEFDVSKMIIDGKVVF